MVFFLAALHLLFRPRISCFQNSQHLARLLRTLYPLYSHHAIAPHPIGLGQDVYLQHVVRIVIKSKAAQFTTSHKNALLKPPSHHPTILSGPHLIVPILHQSLFLFHFFRPLLYNPPIFRVSKPATYLLYLPDLPLSLFFPLSIRSVAEIQMTS